MPQSDDRPTGKSTTRRAATKIIATIGPASSAVDRISELVNAGASVFRINFSHGSRESHLASVNAVRTVGRQVNRPLTLIGDLCGPKIRLAHLPDGLTELATGDALMLCRTVSESTSPRSVTVNLPEILDDLRVGQRVLIDDGAVRCVVVERHDAVVECRCQTGGPISLGKGINLPDTDLHLPALTEKDRADVDWALEQNLDFLALSFARRPAHVHALRSLLKDASRAPQVVIKIETPQAVACLDDMIAAADAVLIARGDLGVEMDLACVPGVQKDAIRRCRRKGKPVIVATQMLQSMVESATPTRAEVSDVANAIVDGADAVMLSAETAIGRHPIAAVDVMRRVAEEIEEIDHTWLAPVAVNDGQPGVTSAVARSMHHIASDIDAQALVVWTRKGTLARLISRHRPRWPVLALTPSARVQRRVELYYGVYPVVADRPEDLRSALTLIDQMLRETRLAAAGDRIVVGFGPQSLAQSTTGSICMHLVDPAPANDSQGAESTVVRTPVR